MKQVIQPAQDLLLGRSASGSQVGANSSKAPSEPDLEGVEQALKSFDAYLREARNLNDGSASGTLSGIENLLSRGVQSGNGFPLDGNDLPVLGQDLAAGAEASHTELDGYITAAENLVASLSESSNAAGQGTANDQAEANIGLFDSPLYKEWANRSAFGSGVSGGQGNDPGRAEGNWINQNRTIGIQANGAQAEGQNAVFGGLSDGHFANSVLSDDLNSLHTDKLNPVARPTDSLNKTGATPMDVRQMLSSNVGESSLINPVARGFGAGENFSNPILSSHLNWVDSRSAAMAASFHTNINTSTNFSGLANAGDLESGLTEASKWIDAEANLGVSSPNMSSKSADASQMLRMRMDLPVQQEGWGREFAMKMRTIAASGEQQASIQLKPAELGAVEINMSTEGDRAKVHFVVQTPAAREALENSLPRLREFLEQAGMSLDDTGIEDRSNQPAFADQQQSRDPSNGSGPNRDGSTGDTAELADEKGSEDQLSDPHNGRLNHQVDFYI